MENFDWTRFTLRIAIKAPMQVLYDAWTKASEIEKWFLSETRFSRADGSAVEHEASIQPGDNYAWRWFLYAETEEGKITEANGSDTLQFTFAGACPVRVALSSQNGYTVVELTQSDIPTDDASKRGIRLGCHQGWSFYLLNLKSVYEGGIDLRNKDERFPPMVNN